MQKLLSRITLSTIILSLLLLTECTSSQQAKIYEDFVADPINSRLPDFSYAGYHYGEKSIPTISEKSFNIADYDILPNTGEDLTEKIQMVLDLVGRQGGGVIYFPKGRYFFNMDTASVQYLKLNYSHVVLRGESSAPDGTVFFNGSPTIQLDESPWMSPFLIRTSNCLQKTKKMWGLPPKRGRNARVQSGSKSDPGQDGSIYEASILASITKDAPKGSSIIQLDRVTSIKPGDVILIGMYNASNEGHLLKELLHPLQSFEDYMTSALLAGPERMASYQFIIEVHSLLNDTTLKLMQPMRRDLLTQYEPVVAEAPMLREVGIENLRLESAWDGHYSHHGFPESTPHEAKIMDYGWNGINFVRVAHGWIRNVVIENFTNPIYIQDSRNVTIENIQIDGYNGHSGITLYGHAENNLIQSSRFDCHFDHLVGGEGNGYGNVLRNISYHYPDKTANFDLHGFAERPFAPMGWNLFENFKGISEIRGSGALFNLPNAGNYNTFWNIEASSFNGLKEIIQYYPFMEDNGKKQSRNDHYRYYPGSILVGYYSTSNDTLMVEGKSDDRDDEWIYIESLNQGKVKPISLYEAQLNLRLQNQ